MTGEARADHKRSKCYAQGVPIRALSAVLVVSSFASCLDSRSLSQFGCEATATCPVPDGNVFDGGLPADASVEKDCRGPAAPPLEPCESAQRADSGVCQVSKRPDFTECASAPGEDHQCFDGVCRSRFRNSVLEEPIDSALSTTEVRIPVNCTLVVDTGDLKSNAPPVLSVSPMGCATPLPAVSVKPYLQPFTNRFVAVLLAKRVGVEGTLRVIGRRPLSVVAEQEITVAKDGVIDANGLPVAPNATLRDADFCAVKDGVFAGPAASGGAGATFGSQGGSGGAASTSPALVPSTESAVGKVAAFVVGCPGGNGGSEIKGAFIGQGGSGGGAVQLYAKQNIFIEGVIRASGSGGRAGTLKDRTAGGGGGSGGVLVLDAPRVTIAGSARLVAVGGGGGSGELNSGQQDETGTAVQPIGGASTLPSSGMGGRGAGLSGARISEAENGFQGVNMMMGSATGGGGGGGLGIIQVNSFTCSKQRGVLGVPREMQHASAGTFATCGPP